MKTARLVIGIVSIALSLFITLQSCAAGIGEAMAGGGTSGSAGMIVSFTYLVAGIVGICARKSKKGSIVAGVFYALGGIIGITNIGIYKDLMIWAILAFLFAFTFIFTALRQKDTLA